MQGQGSELRYDFPVVSDDQRFASDRNLENASPGEQESGRLRTINYGGGARWFFTPRLAFGIDLRAHQLAAGAGTPRVSVFAASAGVSFRK